MRALVPTLALAILAVPVQAHGSGDGLETFSWCVVSGTQGGAAVRYFSGIFEGAADADIGRAFAEYVGMAYPPRVDGGGSTACTTSPDQAAAERSLAAARADGTKARDTDTAWRTHFE